MRWGPQESPTVEEWKQHQARRPAHARGKRGILQVFAAAWAAVLACSVRHSSIAPLQFAHIAQVHRAWQGLRTGHRCVTHLGWCRQQAALHTSLLRLHFAYRRLLLHTTHVIFRPLSCLEWCACSSAARPGAACNSASAMRIAQPLQASACRAGQQHRPLPLSPARPSFALLEDGRRAALL